MALIVHNISFPNDHLGDPLRDAFDNQNKMNAELYSNKVDKVLGKGLSTNDFTTALKNKLENINENAEANVQADWAQDDITADDYIKNKPTELNQNNIALTFIFGNLDGTGDITTDEVSDWLNSQPFQVVVYRTNTPVIFQFSRLVNGINKNYQFHFKMGFGFWGSVGGTLPTNTVYPYYFFLTSNLVLTQDDVTSNPAAVIIALNEVPDGDFIAAANENFYDFTDSGVITENGPRIYYFSYIYNTILYFAQFVGSPDFYGDGAILFVSGDFVASTNSTIGAGFDLQAVTANGKITNKGITITDEKNLRLENGGAGGVDMYYIDILHMMTNDSAYTFKYNDKYVARTVDEIEADAYGNISIMKYYDYLSDIVFPAQKGFIQINNDTNFSSTPQVMLYYNDGAATNVGELYTFPLSKLNTLI